MAPPTLTVVLSQTMVFFASTTMNGGEFPNFYGNARISTIFIPGPTFPVAIFHLKSPSEDYVNSAFKRICGSTCYSCLCLLRRMVHCLVDDVVDSCEGGRGKQMSVQSR